MAFWLKAWNKKKAGSYTVPQISRCHILDGRYSNSLLMRHTDNYTTPIQAVVVAVTLFMAWSSTLFLRFLLVLRNGINHILTFIP